MRSVPAADPPPARPTLLLVDDDDALVALLGDHLERQGFRTVGVGDGDRAVEVVSATPVDLVLLDVDLRRGDGWAVCARLRQLGAPVVLVTGRDAEADKLRGFGLGVDDYVTKPFSFAELAARVRAVLARTARAPGSRRPADAGLVVDLAARSATVHGRRVELTPTEARLLDHLYRHQGRPVPGPELTAAVWGGPSSLRTGQLKRVVWAVRRKIEDDAGDPRLLRTVRGHGYRLDP